MITMIESISDPNTVFIFRPNGSEVQVGFKPTGEVFTNKPLEDDEMSALKIMAKGHNVSGYTSILNPFLRAIFYGRNYTSLTYGTTYNCELCSDPKKIWATDNNGQKKLFSKSVFEII